MAVKMVTVSRIETGFRHITKSIWGREKCNTCFYAEKAKKLIYDLLILVKLILDG